MPWYLNSWGDDKNDKKTSSRVLFLFYKLSQLLRAFLLKGWLFLASFVCFCFFRRSETVKLNLLFNWDFLNHEGTVHPPQKTRAVLFQGEWHPNKSIMDSLVWKKNIMSVEKLDARVMQKLRSSSPSGHENRNLLKIDVHAYIARVW